MTSKKKDELFVKALLLLDCSLYFINQVPNNKYPVKTHKNSYELAAEIEALLKLVDNEDDE